MGIRRQALPIAPRSDLDESEDVVGLTHVMVTVRNPGEHQLKWEGLFLVDTGAIDCMVPGKALREIGLKPESSRVYERADGSELKLDVCVARIEYLGDIVGATVILGKDDCEPILGVTALESAGIIVDPRTNQLKRLPAIPLK